MISEAKRALLRSYPSAKSRLPELANVQYPRSPNASPSRQLGKMLPHPVQSGYRPMPFQH